MLHLSKLKVFEDQKNKYVKSLDASEVIKKLEMFGKGDKARRLRCTRLRKVFIPLSTLLQSWQQPILTGALPCLAKGHSNFHHYHQNGQNQALYSPKLPIGLVVTKSNQLGIKEKLHLNHTTVNLFPNDKFWTLLN